MGAVARVTAQECVHGGGHLPPLIYEISGERRPVMDWHGTGNRAHVLPAGWEKPCRICGRQSMLSDCSGKPCHKVCAEAEWFAAEFDKAVP